MSPARRPPPRRGRSVLRRRLDTAPLVVVALVLETATAVSLLGAGLNRGSGGPVDLGGTSSASVMRHIARDTTRQTVFGVFLAVTAVLLAWGAVATIVERRGQSQAGGRKGAPKRGAPAKAKARALGGDRDALAPLRLFLRLGLALAFVAQPLAIVGCIAVVYEAATATPVSPVPGVVEAVALIAGLAAALSSFVASRFIRSRSVRPGTISLLAATVVLAASGAVAGASTTSGALQHGFWVEHPSTLTGWSDASASISCPDADDCAMVATASALSAGSHWVVAAATRVAGGWSLVVRHVGLTPVAAGATTAGTKGNPNAVTCPDTSECIAWPSGANLAAVYQRSTDGGQTWKAGHLGVSAQGSMSIECPSTTVCLMAYGPDLYRSDDGGVSWHPVLKVGLSTSATGATTFPFVESSACGPGGSPDCVALGTRNQAGLGWWSGDDGSHWRSGEVPKGVTATYYPVCPAVAECLAIGAVKNAGAAVGPLGTVSEHGVLLFTTDGGAHWVDEGSIPGLSSVSSLACTSITECLVTGAATSGAAAVVARTSDRGTRWTKVLSLGGGGLSDVACPQTNDCLAVGSAGSTGAIIEVSADAGTTWTKERFPRFSAG